MGNRTTVGAMDSDQNYDGLVNLLAQPTAALSLWVEMYAQNPMRLPRKLDAESLVATLEPITDALANVVALDRDGIRSDVRFRPGSQELREVEKAVSFAAANLAVDGFTGFDAGALLFSLRDVTCGPLHGSALIEMQAYMEWLVVLAADSLATAREQASLERWHNQLDEGTPLIMITPQLPAALFVCPPDRSVVASIFGRLLLTIVRTGGNAVIIDVSGISGRLDETFAQGLETFVGHVRVATRIRIIVCGVHGDDVEDWKAIGDRHGADLHFENYFDSCVNAALKSGGWRLVAPKG